MALVRTMQGQEPKSRRKSTGYMPLCFVGKAWETLAQALPVNACTAIAIIMLAKQLFLFQGTNVA